MLALRLALSFAVLATNALAQSASSPSGGTATPPARLTPPPAASSSNTSASVTNSAGNVNGQRGSVTRMGTSNTYQNGVHGKVNSDTVVNGTSNAPAFLPVQPSPPAHAAVQPQLNGPQSAPGTVAQPNPAAPSNGH